MAARAVSTRPVRPGSVSTVTASGGLGFRGPLLAVLPNVLTRFAYHVRVIFHTLLA
jgi:hypothetical protein